MVEEIIEEPLAWKALPCRQGIEKCKARRANVEVDYGNLGNSLGGKSIVKSRKTSGQRNDDRVIGNDNLWSLTQPMKGSD